MDSEIRRIVEDEAKRLCEAIRERIYHGVPPPNAPSTVAKKGHGHTLLDEGLMADSIEYRIVEDSIFGIRSEIGVFDESQMVKVLANEFGTDDGHVPERPFLRPVFDENVEEITSRILLKVSDAVLKDLY